MLLIWAFFSTIPFAIAGLVVALVAALVMAIRKQKNRNVWLALTALPLGCGCAPMLFMGGLIGLPILYYANRSAISDYEEVFRVKPGPAIKNLRGRTDAGIDTRTIYLAFTRTQKAIEEIRKLTAKAQGAPNSDLLDGNAYSGDTPDWWQAGHGWIGEKGCLDIVHKNYKDFGYWRDLVIADCPSRNTIFVLASRID